MADKDKPESGSELLTRLVAIVVVMFIGFGGLGALRKYLRHQISHEQQTTLRYPGEWSVGEYRDCDSINLRDEGSRPELDCVGSSHSDREKVFKVSFSGDVTYDDEKPEGTVHYWLCRRNDTEPSFSCSVKHIPQTEPQTTEKQPEPRQLTNDEVEYFRKRNECEGRFQSKKIYEVDGMSIGVACKENPSRRP